jgi:hypothetical protein
MFDRNVLKNRKVQAERMMSVQIYLCIKVVNKHKSAVKIEFKRQ